MDAEKVPKIFLKIPNWPEYSVATLFTEGFITAAEIKQYFPTNDPKKLDRRFVWGVFGFIKTSIAKAYYQETYDSKIKSRLPKAGDQGLQINEDWIEKLLRYEVAPSK